MGNCFSGTRTVDSTPGPATQSPLILTIQPGTGSAKVTINDRNPVHQTATGNVMKGTSNQGGEIIAVKVLRHSTDDQYIEQAKKIKAEAAVWQRLSHPNILPFIGIAEDNEPLLYLLSPWMENGSLTTYLKKYVEANRPQFLLQTASALVYLHENEIIHGDIKGSNILISSDEEPRAMLCDFGLSRRVADPTLPGLKGAGTVRWQAPELWDNKSKSYESDSYSFGMTIYEILSGNVPFHECTGHGTLLAHLNRGKRPEKEPKICPHSNEQWGYLWDIAERCWTHDAEERPKMRTIYRWLQEKRMDEEGPPTQERLVDALGGLPAQPLNGAVSQPGPKMFDGEFHKQAARLEAGSSELASLVVA
ncbi:hypothetical protein FRB99_007439 [Tulasnella sp. 403]|nr:hypothetical protein FRB99_007439 [Tulasnella sp. 403]